MGSFAIYVGGACGGGRVLSAWVVGLFVCYLGRVGYVFLVQVVRLLVYYGGVGRVCLAFVAGLLVYY